MTLAGRRYVVGRNGDEMKKDAAARAAILAALERQLKKGDKSLIGNKGYRRFLATRGDGHFAIDRAKAEEDAKFDGVFVLRTNADLSPLEAMLCYKQLWRVDIDQTWRLSRIKGWRVWVDVGKQGATEWQGCGAGGFDWVGPPKRRDTFNGPMVRRVLIGAGLIEAKRGTPRTIPHRRPDEWTINELAAEIGAPPATIYHWVQKGRLSSRSVEVLGVFNKLVTADAATIASLRR